MSEGTRGPALADPADVLERIVARTREDLLARKDRVPLAALERRVGRSDRDFLGALSGARALALIAEIKPRSPSRGPLRPDLDPAAIASAYDRHAHAISVLTDAPFFGGSLANLAHARAASRLPLLAKDFIVDPYQIVEARAAGADAALLIARLLEPSEIERLLALARSLGMECLVEVHDRAEAGAVLEKTSARIVGVNGRDLRTLEIDASRVFELAPVLRAAGKIVVAESGVETREHLERIAPVADAVLIGTALMRAPDISAALCALGFPAREREAPDGRS